MFPYWLLFSMTAVGAVQYHRSGGRRVQGGPLLIFMVIFIGSMVGMRNEVGGDWFQYVSIFLDIRHEPFWDAVAMPDPGYAVLNWIVTRLGADIWLVNLACAGLFAWGLGKFVRSLPNPWLALVVAVPYLIIVVAMGYTRQAAAIGLILLGLSSPKGRQITRFWVYILFAATFHKTAIIVLPLVALSQTQNRFVMTGIGAVMAGMLYYLFLSSSIDRLLENYVEQEYESEGAAIRVAMNIIPAALFIVFRKRFEMDEDESKLWRNFAWASFAALLFLFTLASSTVVDRLALYLIPLQLVVLSHLPHAFGSKGQANGQLTLAIILYSALVQFVWLTSADNALYWLPYRVYLL